MGDAVDDGHRVLRERPATENAADEEAANAIDRDSQPLMPEKGFRPMAIPPSPDSPRDPENVPLVHNQRGARLASDEEDADSGPGNGFGGYEPFDAYLKSSLHALWSYNATINMLLSFVPVAFILKIIGATEGFVFFASLLGLIPLAMLLGCTTESLAGYTNQTLGGLLNATFGNATEVIISVIAMAGAGPENSLLRVVQLSLLGSILSNLLLVLGCAFLAGGLRVMTRAPVEGTPVKNMQTYNQTAASTNGAMLLLAVAALVFPNVLDVSSTISHCNMLAFSRLTSVMLLGMYGIYLWFQLKTHTHLFEDEDDEEEEDELGLYGAIGYMAILTILISTLSEFLVDSIEVTSRDWGVPTLFIAVILIPIVGNAAEHATAVVMAYKDKMEITMGVAVGSSVQVAVFVIPFMVVSGWVMGKPLSLDFQPFESVTAVMSVLIVNVIISTGTSTYIHGVMLLLLYLMIAFGFILHDSEESHCTGAELCGWEQLACLNSTALTEH